MKNIFVLSLSLLSVSVFAQQKVLTQAIITTKTSIIVPEGQDDQNVPPPPPGGPGEEVRVMRFGGEGDTKSITTMKGDLIKTYTETDMGRTTIIRDNKNKKTTTLLEMMGTKNGFYASDEEQEQMRKQMDSMMQSRRQSGDQARTFTPPTYDILYTADTKKIAGYNCKKAYVVATRKNGKKDSSEVWYTPDFKIQGLSSTGGAGGGIVSVFMRNAGLGGLDKIDGFPMKYETTMGRGRKMIVEVQKIVTDKDIADKEFDVPKDFTLKPMKEMQNAFGRGNFQIRHD